MIHITICVLYSESPEYDEMYLATRWYYKQFSHIRVLYYTFREKMETEYFMDEDTDILYIRGTESIVPGFLYKTIKTFQYVLEHFTDTVYILRTNIRTLINVSYITDFLQQFSVHYGTAIVERISPVYRDVQLGIDNDRFTNVISPVGILLFSVSHLRKWITGIERIDYSVIDDVAIGYYTGKYYSDTNMVCFSEHTTPVYREKLNEIDYKNCMVFIHTNSELHDDMISINHMVRVLSSKEYKTNIPILNIPIFAWNRLLPPVQPLHSKDTTLFVCVSRFHKNTDWTERFRNIVSKVLVYDKENTDNPYNVPVNKGNEASVYLKYIIDHYDTLPDFTYFVHDEEFAWHHSGSVVEKLTEAINSNEYYYNVNDRCVQGSIYINKWYPYVLEWYRIFVNKYIPLECLTQPDWTRGYRGSAQFLVHKTRIQCLPLSFYTEMYEWIITTDAPSFITGRCLEWTWHVFWEKYPYIKQLEQQSIK